MSVISRLTPIPGKKIPEFQKAVSLLQRPYVKISDEEYKHIFDLGPDLFYLDGYKPVTFGSADGGFALMPLTQAAIKKLGITVPEPSQYASEVVRNIPNEDPRTSAAVVRFKGEEPFVVIALVDTDGISVSVGRDITVADVVDPQFNPDAGFFMPLDTIGNDVESLLDKLTVEPDMMHPEYCRIGFGGPNHILSNLISIKAEDEGVVVDIWEPGKPDVLESTWAMYSDLEYRNNGFTKGPWRVSDESSNPHESFVIESEDKVIAWVANTLGDDNKEHTSAQDVANAHLIASAPELMACLNDVLNADGDVDVMDFARYRKAIAAAKGIKDENKLKI